MATIDTLCALVETVMATNEHGAPVRLIKRVVRTYEGRGRADEDMELLIAVSPEAHYRIDDVTHIER